MLDENLPTYYFKPSSDNPLNTLLYFTYQGSELAAEYLLQRPAPSSSQNQYAFGFFDVHAHVLYAEVLLKPEWTQPTLSAAELRANNGVAPPLTANTPDNFAIDLYNPDQTIAVKQEKGSWGRSDAWEFEIPERSFKQPSASKIDEGGPRISELTPRVMFRWKRDGKLSKDMTCYMSGRNVGGKKSKEPDITVALFQAGRHESHVTIYEPNMARVDVEDRKGLEVALLLTAEVIRDLYLLPRQDPFNTAGAPPPKTAPVIGGRRKSSPTNSGRPSAAAAQAVNSNKPLPSRATAAPTSSSPSPAAAATRPIDEETRRLQEMVAREEREARERRDQEEQQRIKRMLQEEEARERQRRNAAVEAETERLRREYGVGAEPGLPARPPPGSLSPLPLTSSGANGVGAGGYSNGGWYSAPRRPTSAGPPAQPRTRFAEPPPPSTMPDSGRRTKTSHQQGAYALGSNAAAAVSGFFGRSSAAEDDKKKKVKKKRSTHF